MITASPDRILDTPLQKMPFFTTEEKDSLHILPRHIAIIPDGNRRWAIGRGESFMNGYLVGAQRLLETTLAAKELGISVVTFFAFSTENWKRPDAEVDMFLSLLNDHLLHYEQSLRDQDIRFCIIGNREKLPSYLQETIDFVTQSTSSGKSLDLVYALNYGGRDELVRTVRKIVAQYNARNITDIDEQTINENLDTHSWPDPDLVIRTSGEQRLSNFMLWQCSYSEHFMEPVCWPDFSTNHLLSVLRTYQMRKRRYGGG
jgi:undecaprenyl diphosphate synthase